MEVTVVLVFVLIFILSSWILRRRRNLPPSRFTVPGIGTLSLLYKSYGRRPYQVLLEEARSLGNVYSFRLCGQLFVVLNSVDSIEEAFVKKADVCSDRPQFFKRMFNQPPDEDGIINNNYGDSWRQLRRFTIQALRDFGVGKTSIEEKILTEVDALTSVLQQKARKPISVNRLMQNVVGNIIFGIIFGRRFDYDDPELDKVFTMTNEFVKGSGIIPVSFFLPEVFSTLVNSLHPQVSRQRNVCIKLRNYIMKQIDDHEATFDKNNIRDFIDIYLNTVTSDEDKGRKYVNKDNMFRVIVDLFIAGSETSSTTLDWACLYMIEHPDVQKKCQEELHKIVGDRIVTYADKGKLKYVTATMHEIQRMANLAPLGAFHQTNADVTLGGYDVPGGTILISNLYASTKDPKYWSEPDSFTPERFLDDNGDLKKTEGLLPFSTGPRVCAGETLAKMELFLVFTNILQRFTLRRERDDVKHTLEAVVDSLTRKPIPFVLRFERRC